MTDQKEKGRIGRRIGKFFKEIRTEMKKLSGLQDNSLSTILW